MLRHDHCLLKILLLVLRHDHGLSSDYSLLYFYKFNQVHMKWEVYDWKSNCEVDSLVIIQMHNGQYYSVITDSPWLTKLIMTSEPSTLSESRSRRDVVLLDWNTTPSSKTSSVWLFLRVSYKSIMNLGADWTALSEGGFGRWCSPSSVSISCCNWRFSLRGTRSSITVCCSPLST